MGFQFQSVATLSDSLVAQFGVTYTQLGLLIGCYLLPGIVVAYPGGMLGKRWGDKQIAVLGLTLMVVGGLVDGVSIKYATFFGGRLIAGIGAVLLNVLLTKMATDWFVGREIGYRLGSARQQLAHWYWHRTHRSAVDCPHLFGANGISQYRCSGRFGLNLGRRDLPTTGKGGHGARNRIELSPFMARDRIGVVGGCYLGVV
jgi:Major Facilitator Superfamily